MPQGQEEGELDEYAAMAQMMGFDNFGTSKVKMKADEMVWVCVICVLIDIFISTGNKNIRERSI